MRQLAVASAALMARDRARRGDRAVVRHRRLRAAAR